MQRFALKTDSTTLTKFQQDTVKKKKNQIITLMPRNTYKWSNESDVTILRYKGLKKVLISVLIIPSVFFFIKYIPGDFTV